MMQFSFFPDILKILPELMQALLAIMVVVGDLFSGDATEDQRFADAASTGAGPGAGVRAGAGAGRVCLQPDLERLNLFDPATCQQATRSNFAVNIWCNLQSVTDPTPGPSGVPNNVLLNGALKVDGLLMMSRLVFIGAARCGIADDPRLCSWRQSCRVLRPAAVRDDRYGPDGGRQRDDRGVSGASSCRLVSLYIAAGYYKGDALVRGRN